MIRKLLLGTVAGFALTSAALAQINSVPQVGVISGILNGVSVSSGLLHISIDWTEE
jgi:hypothetical protein